MVLSDLHIDYRRLTDCCQRFGVTRLEAFGSFASGAARGESDVDLLVTFKPGVALGLELVALQQALEEILGRHVDLLSRESVERSPNKYFRRFALQHTEPIYES